MNEFWGMKFSNGEFHGPNTKIIFSMDLNGFCSMGGIFRDEDFPLSFLTIEVRMTMVIAL